MKRTGIRLFSITLFIFFIFAIIIPFNAKADTTVTDSRGNIILTAIMENGKITITAYSHAASTNIRWETIGLTFTKERITTSASTKGYTGPGPVSDAYGSGKATLWFKNAKKSDSPPADGIVTTIIEFNAEQVEDAFHEDFSTLKNGTTIYMHGIFDTYQLDGSGNKTIRQGGTYGIRNWETIMNAESWGSDTLGDFEKLYNMAITFDGLNKQNNTLIYERDDGTKFRSEALASQYPGDNVTWSNKDKTITKNYLTYQLVSSYITKKLDETSEPYEKRSVGTTYSIDAIRSGSTVEVIGGVNVHLVYKLVNQKNTLYYIDEATGTQIYPSKPLNEGYIGDFAYWKNEPASIPYSGKTYDLIGFYEIDKLDTTKTKHDATYLSDGATLAQLRSNGLSIQYGGDNIYLVYRKRGAPTPTPSPTPVSGIPTPIVTAAPTLTPIEVPEEETVTDSLTPIEATGYIRADNRGSEKFTVTSGVPTTESLFTEVQATSWLMGYNLKKQVGIETYPVTVTKKYILKWQGKDATGVIEKTETKIVTKIVNIKRAYGYWEIMNFDLYEIAKAVINNYALPNGSTTMYPRVSAGYVTPTVSTNHSPLKEMHIVIPDEIKNGITLPDETIIGTTKKPIIPDEDFTLTADELIPELMVTNDNLILNGTTVMDDTPTEKEGPTVDRDYLSQLRIEGMEFCNENVMYQPNQIIEATKKNGTYNSSGYINYTRVNSINSQYMSSIQNNIVNLSTVVIHTPVLCDPIVTADNDKYVQLLSPSAATQLVLDPDKTLNDFTLKISNYGPHSYIQGYFTRDFSRSLRDPLNVSYIESTNGVLRNEVKFPFDVYLKQSTGDKYIKKNTWIVLGRNTGSFYLPMWVDEGIYTVECRSIAVNADMSRLDQISEQRVNSKLFNYVATETFKLEVSGRLYGLSIYDISDYPMWKEVFRVKNSLQLKINDKATYPDGTSQSSYSKGYSYNYTVGTNDQYGNDTTRIVKYTFPLVNGSHPKYANIGILSTGYAVRFKLNTIGNMYGSACSIRIKPSFYYVDANGKNRTAVDIYYEEEINKKNYSLVKVGSSLDQLNVKTMEAGSPYTGIPKSEMKDTASILNMKYSKFIYNWERIFTFKNINILSAFRTYVNKTYAKNIVNSSEYTQIQTSGVTQNSLTKLKQSWYGCYYLPGIMHAVDPNDVPNGWTVYEYASKKGISYHESFWKKSGYIIVNFDIVTVDSNGNERLSYINTLNYLNNGNNSMWTMEGAPLSKTDNKGVTFNLKVGDFILYDTESSIQKDYSVGGIY